MSDQRRNIKKRGTSLVEALIAAGMFTLLSIALAVALKQSSVLWTANSSQLDATQRLRKVAVSLEREIPMIDTTQFARLTVPATLPSGGFDGDVIWFLSHINPVDGKPYIKSDGTPFWQCNIIYYCVTPSNVQQMTNAPINSGVDPDGYEDRCPHKILIRKVVDFENPTDPSDESTEEVLLADITPYLTQPNQLNIDNMLGEDYLLKVDIIATDLLYFRANPSANPPGIQFDIRSTALEEAQRVAVTPAPSLLESPYTAQSLLFVAARNTI